MAETSTALAALDRFIENFTTERRVESDHGVATVNRSVATAKPAENKDFGHCGHCGHSESVSYDAEPDNTDNDRDRSEVAAKVSVSSGHNGQSGQSQENCGFERDHRENGIGHSGQFRASQQSGVRRDIRYHRPDPQGRLFRADPANDPESWQHLYQERAGIREFDGGYSRPEAERLAWGELEWRWHMAHGAPVVPGVCAGCGQPISNEPVISLIDANNVHDRPDNACLIRFGECWRGAARASLIALGLKPPPSVE